jgi:hypothetical protein
MSSIFHPTLKTKNSCRQNFDTRANNEARISNTLLGCKGLKLFCSLPVHVRHPLHAHNTAPALRLRFCSPPRNHAELVQHVEHVERGGSKSMAPSQVHQPCAHTTHHTHHPPDTDRYRTTLPESSNVASWNTWRALPEPRSRTDPACHPKQTWSLTDW